MSDEPIKRPRGRPRKIKPEEPRPTTTIQEGASWQVGVPMPEHYDGPAPGEPVTKYQEAMSPLLQPNSVVQIRTESRMGTLALIGEVEDNQVHCYAFVPDGGMDYFTVKTDEVFVVSPPRKGLRVMSYKKPEVSPDWHSQDGT